jgi:hypothetical protein
LGARILGTLLPMVAFSALVLGWVQRQTREATERGLMDTARTVSGGEFSRRVRRHGPLGGDGPLLQLLSIAQLRRRVPLGAPGSVGSVHLDKGLGCSDSDRAGHRGQHLHHFIGRQAALRHSACALPQWWGAWQAASFLPVEDGELPGEQQGPRHQRAGRQSGRPPRRQQGDRKPRQRKSC